MKAVVLLTSLALACVPVVVLAHSGGTDSNGCHTNRKTGDHHCHGGGRRSAAPAQPGALRSSPPAHGAYANCSAARAAGAAPVRRGDPGYGAHLDRDGDGVGCEG